MIRYVCKHCDNLVCETSICPVCGNRTEVQSTNIYWCIKLNTPSFDEYVPECDETCLQIATDLRPVFPEERLLIEVLLGKPFEFANKSIWKAGGNTYIVNGKKITFSYSKYSQIDRDYVISQLKKYENENKKYVDDYFNQDFIKNFIRINRSRLSVITSEACEYIRNESKKFDIDDMFVSFSGGKDSTVTSHLVMTALNNQSIIHIYGDTTLEYPTSEEYIKRFKKEYPYTPMLVAKNTDQSFMNLCEVIGPPSRVLRWCCTVFKTGSITKKIENAFGDKQRILTFYGIRRNESLSRSKYERESNSPKITKQLVVSPIIDWIDFDVWLYIISNNLDFNYAYKQGFARVGCWCCPNNSNWSAYLSSIYMPEQFDNFRNMLLDYAKKTNKEDPVSYVDEGMWKARQGGIGLEASKNTVVEFKPCAFDDKSINFDLSRPIDDKLYTLFSVFGILNRNIGNKRLNEIYVLDNRTKQPLFSFQGKEGQNHLKVSIHNIGSWPFTSKKVAESLIKAQVTKFQTCIGCHACESVCKHNAIKILNTEKGNAQVDNIMYSINPSKCVHCLECVNHFPNGCYMCKVLRTKKGGQNHG